MDQRRVRESDTACANRSQVAEDLISSQESVEHVHRSKKTHLVGLDSSNLLIGLDKVANLLVPLLQGTLGDGLSHLGNLDDLLAARGRREAPTNETAKVGLHSYRHGRMQAERVQKAKRVSIFASLYPHCKLKANPVSLSATSWLGLPSSVWVR